MQEDFTRRVIELGLVPQMVNRNLFTTLSDVAGVGDTRDVFGHVSKKVGILFTSRSGSTFLANYLTRSGLFGDVQEHLSAPVIQKAINEDGIESMRTYLKRAVQRATGDNGVFAFKGTIQSLVPLAQIGELPDNIGDWRWIVINREDTVAQAVSLFRARRTGRWHRKRGRKRKIPVPAYDFDAILRCYNHTLRMTSTIESFIRRQNIAPLRLSYEKFQSDPIYAVTEAAKWVSIDAKSDRLGKLRAKEFKVLRNAKTIQYADRFRQDLADRLLRIEGFK